MVHGSVDTPPPFLFEACPLAPNQHCDSFPSARTEGAPSVLTGSNRAVLVVLSCSNTPYILVVILRRGGAPVIFLPIPQICRILASGGRTTGQARFNLGGRGNTSSRRTLCFQPVLFFCRTQSPELEKGVWPHGHVLGAWALIRDIAQTILLYIITRTPYSPTLHFRGTNGCRAKTPGRRRLMEAQASYGHCSVPSKPPAYPASKPLNAT